jgi:hypothetical protein
MFCVGAAFPGMPLLNCNRQTPCAIPGARYRKNISEPVHDASVNRAAKLGLFVPDLAQSDREPYTTGIALMRP